jgi:hypothetical protein
MAFILGIFDLPSEKEMDVEVAIWHAWSGKRYQPSKGGNMLMLFMTICRYVYSFDNDE